MPNVVDENYDIKNDPNPELFHVQNRFFFSVLSHTLKTDRGKAIIREFAKNVVNGNFDGRGAFLALKKVMKSGNKGKFQKRELKRFLWSAVFKPSSNFTAEAFIINLKDKMRQLEEYESHPIDDEDKISIISQAIEECPELHRVVVDADILNRTLDFEDFYELVQNAAIEYDQNTSKFKRQAIIKQAMVDLENSDDYFEDYEDPVSEGLLDMSPKICSSTNS